MHLTTCALVAMTLSITADWACVQTFFFWMCEHKLGVHLGSRTVWGGDSQGVYGTEVMTQNQVKALQQN